MAHVYHLSAPTGDLSIEALSIDTPEDAQNARDALREYGVEWAAVYMGAPGTPGEHVTGSKFFAWPGNH